MTAPLFSEDLVLKNSATTGSLVELYSSEGCSSCPPAEAWISHLKNAPGLWTDFFPMVFHVDYWDGLGWPDRFARAEFTQRQRDYATRLGQESVYTPEFVVNGAEWRRSWLGGQGLPTTGAEKSGSLSLTVQKKEKNIAAFYTPGKSASATGLEFHVAFLGFNLITDVKRGENSGRKLEHDFVVLALIFAPMTADGNDYRCDPVAVTSTTEDAPDAVVGWVSGPDGAILQVAGGWLSPASRPAH